MQTTLLSIAYLFGLLGGLWLRWSRSRTFRERERPVSEKMLRSPGESLTKKFETDMERLVWLYVLLCLLPVIILVPLGGSRSDTLWQGWKFPVCAVGLFVLGYVLSMVLTKHLMALSNVFLGLKGERLVGELLNWLMKDGYDVFHDFPIEPDGKSGNIDHVVVGPTGVFAIETKTRRKPKDTPDGRNYEVIYDGEKLKFPHFTTRKGIDQSVHNARLLAKHLGASLDHQVDVIPILTLPGWFVSSQSNEPLLVLNPKMIRSAIVGKNEVIDESLQKKIAYQLELRCRDVEF